MTFDCQQCGACCVDYFGTPGYIWLRPGEPQKMRKLGLPVVGWQGQVLLGTRPHEGPGGERCCAAFEGKAGESCRCSIYDDRPGECRAFEVGSLGCLFARQEAGLPV
jgi:hypothetical protein